MIVSEELFYRKLSFNSKINELSDEKKNKYISKLFNDLFYYLNSIDINNNFDIVIFINDKYLKHKKTGKNNEVFENMIKKLIIDNITKNYFDKILELYSKNKKTNLMINHYCLFFIYKIILLLYSYYYYISNITLGYRQTDILNKIDYKIIMSNFSNDFIENNVKKNKHINIYELTTINTKNKRFAHYKYNLFLKKILTYISLLQEIYKEPNLNYYKKEYITIPQYIGNCWYIAMLTCMTYSDLSKKLILSKIDNEAKKNKLISSSKYESNKIFIKIIDYIIQNITKENKKYGDDIYLNCSKLTYLKEHIMDYIYQRYYELNSEKRFKASLNTFNGLNDYYYKALNRKINESANKKEINKIKLLTNEVVLKYDIKVGANIHYANVIINTFYNIFNISTLYLFDYIRSSNYLRQKNIEYDSEKSLNSPDIIFIHKKDFQLNGDFLNFDKNKITKIDKNTIIFNNYKYKLDFILHSTDHHNTCANCGHCIAGIHYNGEQYYHDSGYIDLMLKCNSKYVNIPCTLIHQKWVDDIEKAEAFLKSKNYTDVEDICLFNIQKCFHKITDITSHTLNKNIIKEDTSCFNNLFNLIYAYIKIDDTSSDKKEEEKKEIKVKSSGVKVDIMNNNKLIKRIIYLDKNNNKYVKLNKDYILLSGLIKKDDVYYNEHNKQKKEIKGEEKKEKKEIKVKSSGVKVDIMNNNKLIKRIIYLDKNNNKYVKLNKDYVLLSNLKII